MSPERDFIQALQNWKILLVSGDRHCTDAGCLRNCHLWGCRWIFCSALYTEYYITDILWYFLALSCTRTSTYYGMLRRFLFGIPVTPSLSVLDISTKISQQWPPDTQCKSHLHLNGSTVYSVLRPQTEIKYTFQSQDWDGVNLSGYHDIIPLTILYSTTVLVASRIRQQQTNEYLRIRDCRQKKQITTLTLWWYRRSYPNRTDDYD